MVRLLHTSDWQLGLKLRFIEGDRGARARQQRFETVGRLGELARERQVDAVVVAGDVFDDNGVGDDTLQQARDALESFAPIPVLLLPGNHDAATPASALARLAPEEHGLAHVHALLERRLFSLGTADIFPCPLLRRHSAEDPTAWLPARQGETAVRVALAHGGVREFSESTETPNRIDLEAVLAKGFDYVALGDWHGTVQLGPRAAYSGAPEATRFQEKEVGQALVVEIDGPGAAPRVEKVAVARSRWLQVSRSLERAEDVEALATWLQGLEAKSWTLLDLRLEGSLAVAERARLEEILTPAAAGQLLHLRVADEGLQLRPSAAELEALAGEGFLGRAADRLRRQAEAGSPDASSPDASSTAAQDALLLLFRLLREQRA